MRTRFLFVLATGLLLTSCASTRGQLQAERYYKRRPDLNAAGHALQAGQQKRDSAGSVPPVPLAITDKPGLFSGIGHLFSTPAGIAHRQAVRLAKAAAPKIGKKAQGTIQNGNGNTSTQSNSNKAEAPATAAGPAATVSNAAENSQQQNAQGDNNDLSAKQANPQQEAPSLGAVAVAKLTGPVGIIGGILLLAIAGGVVWYLVPLIPKRRKNSQA